MEECLEEQIKTEERGMQPEMILGCFLSLKRGDDEYCKNCKLYFKCGYVLDSFRAEEKPYILK
jgi:hypothetical protein